MALAAASAAWMVSVARSQGSGAGDVTADVVLGQADFSSTSGAAGQSGLKSPLGVAIDRSVTPNCLYVADSFNNRVLGWHDVTALTNGAPFDLIIGQPSLNSVSTGNGPTGLDDPVGLAVDSQGNLYVADSNNNRVLEYNTPYSLFGRDCTVANPCVGGFSANLVFGQGSGTDFTHNICYGGNHNAGGMLIPVSATGMCDPTGVALDSNSNLYVVDSLNNRVLEFNQPSSGPINVTSNMVFGQGPMGNGFTTDAPGTSATAMSLPLGVALDSNNNLYVTDWSNNRVLEFDNPLGARAGCSGFQTKSGCPGDAVADLVFGQGPSGSIFTTNSPGTSATAMNLPYGIALDSNNIVYVVDSNNNRALGFDEPSSRANNFTADLVFGQGPQGDSFGSRASSAGATGFNGPAGVAVDSNGDLFIADANNNRVLEFFRTLVIASATASSLFTPTPTPIGTQTRARTPTPAPTATPAATVTPTQTPIQPSTQTASPTPPPPPSRTPTPLPTLIPPGGTLSLPARTLNFGTVKIGMRKTLTFLIRNAGKGALRGNVDTSGTVPPLKVTDGAGAFRLGHNQVRKVSVQAAPTKAGAFSSLISITSGDRSHPAASVSVKGRGH